MIATLTTSQRGQIAENAACDYLRRQGLKLREKNFRSPAGEIDLIMQDGEIIVFVEVRYRSSDQVTSAVETINSSKRRRIVKAGGHYLQKHRLSNAVFCRFDVVILGRNASAIEWFSNAFDA
jgi:putative endonuclease